MRRSVLLLLLLIFVITITGCNKEEDIELNNLEQTMRVVANKAQIDEIENGDLCIDDLLFINESTTWEQMLEKIGQPDAVDIHFLSGNLLTYVYKLKDNGAFKIQFKGTGECHWAYIVYDDSIIVLFGSDDFCKSVGEKENIDMVKCLRDIY